MYKILMEPKDFVYIRRCSHLLGVHNERFHCSSCFIKPNPVVFDGEETIAFIEKQKNNTFSLTDYVDLIEKNQ